jgi:hypothetical protein
LPQPLRAWLTKSYLTEPINNVSVLFVESENFNILNNFYFLHKIYPIAKQVHDEIHSLHLSSLPLLDSLQNKKVLRG